MTSPPTSRALLPLPPPTPRPWLWQCHLCGRIWNLGVTRRCLSDGHFFCNERQMGIMKETGNALYKEERYHRRKVYCVHQFDFRGWDMYNYWRREVADIKEQAGPSAEGVETAGSSNYEDEDRRDCWNNCDFPNECHSVAPSSPRTTAMTEGEHEKESEREKREVLNMDMDMDNDVVETERSPAVEFTIPFIGLEGADDDEAAADITLDSMDIDL